MIDGFPPLAVGLESPGAQRSLAEPPSLQRSLREALARFQQTTCEEGRRLIEPVRRFGETFGEHIGANPYVGWQQGFDPLLTPGARNYWTSHNFAELRDGAIDAIIE